MKILFFAHDAGGANAIAPIITRFSNAIVFAKGPALNILPNAKILPDNALHDYNPDFIVTGTSANDFTERFLWKEAETLSIPCMAILDTWINYGARFSKYTHSELHLFDGNCHYLPTFLCVMDEIAKKDAVKDGVPESIIVPLGNPHFEAIASNSMMDKTSTGKQQIILFASQVFRDVWRKDSELIVLNDLIRIASQHDFDKINICIRKHPLEENGKFDEYLSNRVFIDNSHDVISSIQIAEVVVSVSSMVLLEASIYGKKIISYQPRSKDGKKDFILTRNGALPFITSFDEFKSHLNALMKERKQILNTRIAYSGIIDRITTFVKEHSNV